MPYKKSSPPDRIKKLPKHAQSIWIEAFNSAYDSGNSEKSCNKIAWAAVKKKYKKEGDKWVKKGSEMETIPFFLSDLDVDISGEQSKIQVFPYGSWEHSAYGDITIDEKALEGFIENFRRNIRNDIPITEGHSVGGEEKPAVGWFKELVNKGRDGLWAIVEWTEEGKKLLKQSAYKYFSPEFYSVYEDPETHKEYKNVLVGGALTNRPYFKELQAVELSELKFSENMVEEEEKNKQEVDKEKEDEEQEEEDEEQEEQEEGKEKASEEDEEEEEEEKKKKEASERVMIRASVLKELEKKAEAGLEAKKELNEMRIERETESLIFSEKNQKGKLLPKSRDKVRVFLASLSEGQRKQFKEILADLPSGKLFSELGGGSDDEPNSAEEKLNKSAEKLMKESDISYADAVSQVFADNPELEKEMGYSR